MNDTMAPDSPGRRSVLRYAGLGFAALAGCVGGNTSEGTPEPTSRRTGTPEATSSPDPTATESPAATEPSRGPSWFRPWGTVLDDFETFERDWTTQHGAATVSDDGFLASPGVRVDTAGASRARLVREFAVPRDLGDRGFSLAAKLHSTTKPLVQVAVVLEDTAGNRRYHSGSIQSTATDRWLRLDAGVSRDDGLDPTSVSELWIEHYAGDTETVLSVADLRTVPTPETGVVVLSFSNEAPADYTVARDVLAEYGYAGVCFPTTETIGTDPTPGAETFRELQAAGWDVGGHTPGHERLPEHSRATQRDLLATNARELRELGLDGGPRHFRAPYADYDSNTLDVVLESFDTCVSGAGSASGTLTRLTDPRMVGFRSGKDLDDAKADVDAAGRYGQLLGLTVPLEDIDRAHLEALVGYVDRAVGRGEVEVLTLSELYARGVAR